MVSFTARDPVFSVRRRTKFLLTSVLTLLSAVIGAYGKFFLVFSFFFFYDVITFLPSISHGKPSEPTFGL